MPGREVRARRATGGQWWRGRAPSRARWRACRSRLWFGRWSGSDSPLDPVRPWDPVRARTSFSPQQPPVVGVPVSADHGLISTWIVFVSFVPRVSRSARLPRPSRWARPPSNGILGVVDESPQTPIPSDSPTTAPTAAALRPRARPRPLDLVHQYREVIGLEDANLLGVEAEAVEPLDCLLAVPRPRGRGPFSGRMVSVRQEVCG
jgi:hypothetical protein